MDFFDILLQIGLVTATIVCYLIFFRKPAKKGFYSQQGWNYILKVLWARYEVKRWKARRAAPVFDMEPRRHQTTGWDSITFRASSKDGATVYIGVRKLNSARLAEVTLFIRLPDGCCYKLPVHPETAYSDWVESPDGSWTAGRLKIQMIEPQRRMRIIFNDLLTDCNSGDQRHVKFNFIWTYASKAFHHPDDWSDQLAAEALALETWNDGRWLAKLDHSGETTSVQWGAIQGRVEAFDSQGTTLTSHWLRLRGALDRSAAPRGFSGLRRGATLTLVAADGTMLYLGAKSYHDVLTHVVTGNARFPNFDVKPITSTDFSLQHFGEVPEAVPDVFTVNVGTSFRNVRLVVRGGGAGGVLLSGSPHSHAVHYRLVTGSVDGYAATGLLELGYERTNEPRTMPKGPVFLEPTLSWLPISKVDHSSYCASFNDKAAACPELVGGKCASLALLTKVKGIEGYEVPPGYCITRLALDKQLDANPQIMSAIQEIEDANEDYNEENFKAKCNKVVELLTTTEIVPEVQDEILSYLKKLRKEALDQNLGPELKFAVRSSAVGEDSEALSAAGQNDTVLGCVTDQHVLDAVRKCWASMYAFTSAFYRRQNGQCCVCGGALAVQALVRARAAGVLFTAHPAHPAGDPTRALVTANYGLGESVVSGTVEPDTYTIIRSQGQVAIEKIELGSKTQKIAATEDGGVTSLEVPEDQRHKSCLSEDEILELGRLAVRQERNWGAPRDIEWAYSGNTLYLLQARPITSLERWTEEELLHEADTATMSDDSFCTFANIGEVMPKPCSPLTRDLVMNPLLYCMAMAITGQTKDYNPVLAITHNRIMIDSYNTLYRVMPEKIDFKVRMLEMSLHGHTVADDHMLSIARHINPPQFWDKARQSFNLISSLFYAKSCMKDNIKLLKRVKMEDFVNEDPVKMLELIKTSEKLFLRSFHNHVLVSSASTATQIIAMSILLEGTDNFSPEQCNEIGAMLSTGEAVSAMVPRALCRLARAVDAHPRAALLRENPPQPLHWLRDNMPDVHQEVLDFLDEHGHRALMEFDLATKPWALQPESLIDIIKSMRVSKEDTDNTNHDRNAVSELSTPKKPITRKLLSWFLPYCRRIVVYRESTKAQSVLAIHKLRLAIIKLGQLMVKRWMLPHPDIVFYFYLHELEHFIKTRDPVLLRKAQQRRHYFPSWGKIKFPENVTGWPEPLAASPLLGGGGGEGGEAEGGEPLRATAVCGGDVVARACVVKDLSEIGQLQQGDILITHSTDIGWSPYFPLVSGIVTELGGLISHGAVIAREYGLPCVVGAAGATDRFRTGDRVRLRAARGTLARVAAPGDA